MNNTTKTELRRVNKSSFMNFKEGQIFVVKVANTTVGSIAISNKLGGLLANIFLNTSGRCSLWVYPYLLTNDILKGYAIYEMVPVSGEGVIKTEQTEERYIVWCPASTSPCQQIFTSARQARYVAYRMSEEHKGKVFHWAKLEGSAHWGPLE